MTVPGDKSISHRCAHVSGIAGRSERDEWISRERRLHGKFGSDARLGVRIDQRARRSVDSRVGLHGLRAPASALDMGNAGTAMRLFTGLLSAQQFDSQLVGDATLMKRPMERVARPLREMGADVRTRKAPTDRHLGGHRFRQSNTDAGRQRTGQIRAAAGRVYADAATTIIAPEISRDHSERMLRVAAYASVPRAARHLHPRGSIAQSADRCARGISHPPPSSSWQASWERRARGCYPKRRSQSDTHRITRHIAPHGRQYRLICIRAHSAAEPVADLLRPCVAVARHPRPRRIVPSPSMNCPSCSSPQPVPRARLVVSGAEELRVKESDRIAAMSAGLRVGGVHSILPDGMRIEGRGQDRAFGGGVIDSFGDHRIAMSFSHREPARGWADLDPGRGQCGDLVSGICRRWRGRWVWRCGVGPLRYEPRSRHHHRWTLRVRQGDR